jgi:hypothetical protein
MTDDDDRAKQERALRSSLHFGSAPRGGTQDAADLVPLMPAEPSLSKVAFQLERLADERRVSGKRGGFSDQ